MLNIYAYFFSFTSWFTSDWSYRRLCLFLDEFWIFNYHSSVYIVHFHLFFVFRNIIHYSSINVEWNKISDQIRKQWAQNIQIKLITNYYYNQNNNFIMLSLNWSWTNLNHIAYVKFNNWHRLNKKFAIFMNKKIS